MLQRLDEALRDYECLHSLAPNTDAYPILLGIIRWWQERPGDAVDWWREAHLAAFTDAAGGVTAPAMLFFAASRLGETKLRQEAVAGLRQRWSPEIARVWPGPIAGFLLGEMDL